MTWSRTLGASDSVAAILSHTFRRRTSFFPGHMQTTVEREWDSLREAVEIIVN